MFILELILLAYFIYVVSYAAVFSFAAYFYKVRKLPGHPPPSRFCVLIPSYKEDAVIRDTAIKALHQSYPQAYFDVVIIADSLQPETILELKKLPIRLIEVSFEKSTKVKSLNTALAQLNTPYDYAVILDADNVMAFDFLEKMNAVLRSGNYCAVQGQRKPKNTETTLAFLDGISEAINNHIYRQGTTALRLSSSISGSGVALEYELLKEKLSRMTSVGGFDRELELRLLREHVKVHYFREAVVLDEKVSRAGAFQNQRRRWIASQYFYLRKYFKEGMAALLNGNMVFFNSCILRNIQLPRLLNIGLLFILVFTFFWVQHRLSFSYYWWPALFTVNAIAVFAAIPKEYFSNRLLYAILSLPILFARMTSQLFRMRGANRSFIHTPHNINSLNNDR